MFSIKFMDLKWPAVLRLIQMIFLRLNDDNLAFYMLRIPINLFLVLNSQAPRNVTISLKTIILLPLFPCWPQSKLGIFV